MRLKSVILGLVVGLVAQVAYGQGRVIIIDESGKAVGYRVPKSKTPGNRFVTQGGGMTGGFGSGDASSLPLYSFKLSDDDDDEASASGWQSGGASTFGTSSNVRSRGAMCYVEPFNGNKTASGAQAGLSLESVEIPQGMDMYYDLRTGKTWFWPANIPCPVPPVNPQKKRPSPVVAR